MRRFFVFLLVLIISTPTTVLALIPSNLDVHDTAIFTPDINNIAQDQAEMLNKLNLFSGTDKGFELDKELTRAESAVMIVRLMGDEKEALSKALKHPFTDVPVWADSYIGWLYQNKITYGVSATLYGSKEPVTYRQYATFLSRVCFGHDNFLWDDSTGTKSELHHFETNGGFKRAEVVALTVRALRCLYTREMDPDNIFEAADTLAQHLVNKGVFTTEQLLLAGPNVFPFYCGDGAEIAGVQVLKNSLEHLYGTTSYPHPHTEYHYSWTCDGTEIVLYRVDCRTFQETELGHFTVTNDVFPGSFNFIDTVGSKDYLWFLQYTASHLVCIDGDKSEVVESIADHNWFFPLAKDDNCFAGVIEDTLYTVTSDGMSKRILDPNTTFVGLTDEIIVLYRVDEDRAFIEGININSWEVTDSYEVEVSAWTPVSQNADGIYGLAGYYEAIDGHLIQITKRPTLAVGELRVLDTLIPVIVSHQPGEYRGSSIIVIDREHHILGDEDELVLLDNNPPHGISIDGIVPDTGPDLMFYKMSVGAMQHTDVFTYKLSYNETEGHQGISVVSLKIAQPDLWANDTEWYMEREQERLNDLGYNPD